MTFELGGIQDPTAQRNFQTLSRLLIDTGGRSVGLRFGADTVTFTASVNSAVKTVTHGLGRTPITVVATASGSLGWNVLRVFNFTATTFDVQGHDTDAARTGSDAIYWVAVG